MHYQHTSWLQRLLEKIWYQQGQGKWLLLPFTLLYCLLHAFRRWKLSRKCSSITPTVIIVGNISIGGTGKTPAVIYLTQLLIKAGYKPAIITRGYGGKSIKWPQEIMSNNDPKDVGDEAVLLANRVGVPVVAGFDRYVDIQYLRSRYDCDVIISDDGLQHYNLHRDIEIALIDAERQLGNGWCLPAGPLREGAHRLKQVDFVLFNHGFIQNIQKKNSFRERYSLASLFSMRLSGDVLVSLSDKDKIKKIADLEGETVHAVAGIGNPSRFYTALEKLDLHLIKHSFPDHHIFKAKELNFNDNNMIIMTEKDAVKCAQFSLKNSWYFPIEAEIDKEFEVSLINKLKRLKHG